MSPSGSTRVTVALLYSLPFTVLTSSASAIDAYSAAAIASMVFQYLTRRILPLVLSTRQRQSDIHGRNDARDVYDVAGTVIETHEHVGEFKEW